MVEEHEHVDRGPSTERTGRALPAPPPGGATSSCGRPTSRRKASSTGIGSGRRAPSRGTPRPLPQARAPLDLTFESRGATRTIDELMRREFVSGLLVVKDGEIRLERYAMGLDPRRCWQSSSMVKSLAAILVGAAVQDGAIGNIGQSIIDYLPELAGSAWRGRHHPQPPAHGLRASPGSRTPTTSPPDVAEHYIKVDRGPPAELYRRLPQDAPRANPPGHRSSTTTPATRSC